MDQMERRVLQGETIPHEEKVFSIFQPHTRWCAKGKAGVPVELGVPVAVVESRQQFVLHWQLLWEEEDVEVACSLVEQTQQLYPQLEACSFDKGFHSPANQRRLDEQLELNALPRKGRLTKAQREREQELAFREARQVHAAVESAINNIWRAPCCLPLRTAEQPLFRTTRFRKLSAETLSASEREASVLSVAGKTQSDKICSGASGPGRLAEVTGETWHLANVAIDGVRRQIPILVSSAIRRRSGHGESCGIEWTAPLSKAAYADCHRGLRQSRQVIENRRSHGRT